MIVVVLLLVVAASAAAYVYYRWIDRELFPRSFVTPLSSEQLRELFRREVARVGWRVVDEGNPMEISSTLATGERQRIALHLAPLEDGRVEAWFGPTKLSHSYLLPDKPHTVRRRMARFERAVQGLDRSVSIVRNDPHTPRTSPPWA
jgi:hypothetical protein